MFKAKCPDCDLTHLQCECGSSQFRTALCDCSIVLRCDVCERQHFYELKEEADAKTIQPES